MRELILSIIFAATASSSHALSVQALDMDIHDWDRSKGINDGRDPAKSFIGDGFDWSGVGRSSDGKWATMVSDRVFLSANHFHPGVGSTITFFTNNLGSTQDVVMRQFQVVRGEQIPGTDLWMGVLDQSITEDIAIYEIFSAPDSFGYENLGQSGLTNQQPARLDLDPPPNDDVVFMVGKSGATDETSFRVGLQVSTFFSSTKPFSFGEVGPVLDFEYNDASVEADQSVFTDFEAFLEGGDSGGPTFWSSSPTSSELQLLGVHAGNSSRVWKGVSSDSLPGESLTEIQAFTSSLQAQVVINEVSPNTNRVELWNTGTSPVDVSGWWFYSLSQDQQLSNATVVEGNLILEPGAFLVLDIQPLNNSAADLGLYNSGGNFDSTSAMEDYVQWGSGGNGGEMVAASKGIWVAGTFVTAPTTGQSIIRDGQATGANGWSVTDNPSFGAANSPPSLEGWISFEHFPFVWSHKDEEWIFFEVDSAKIFVYSFNNNDWASLISISSSLDGWMFFKYFPFVWSDQDQDWLLFDELSSGKIFVYSFNHEAWTSLDTD